MKKVAFKTFGCKANSTDTDALFLEARKRGFNIVDEDAVADAYVINSCTVTYNADRDARIQAMRFKRQNPGSLVGVVGCYAQVSKEELLNLPDVDFVVGTSNKFKILDHLQDTFQQIPVARDQVEDTKGFLPPDFLGSRYARAPIKIQDGCNFKCSFCIIPQARGRSRSLSLEIVVKQVQDAYEQGYNEVILTGIHLAHYGWDVGSDLETLVKTLLDKPQGPRIRLSTLDPFEIPDSMIALLGQDSRLCPHFHIAIQSGSDDVLKQMRRFYKATEFKTVCDKIYATNPNTFVGVDVIVGFPGEGEKEFEETVTILQNSYWTKLHVFPFSERRGTAAADLENPVADAIKTERSQFLRAYSDIRLDAFMQRQIGREVNVILERPSDKHPGLWQGHTENYVATYSQVPGSAQTKQVLRSRISSISGDRAFTIAQ